MCSNCVATVTYYIGRCVHRLCFKDEFGKRSNLSVELTELTSTSFTRIESRICISMIIANSEICGGTAAGGTACMWGRAEMQRRPPRTWLGWTALEFLAKVLPNQGRLSSCFAPTLLDYRKAPTSARAKCLRAPPEAKALR